MWKPIWIFPIKSNNNNNNNNGDDDDDDDDGDGNTQKKLNVSKGFVSN